MTMKLDPPLRRGPVEVTSINEELHTIHCLIHIVGTPEDITTMEGQALISQHIRKTFDYLATEAFINPTQHYLTHIGAILHIPN